MHKSRESHLSAEMFARPIQTVDTDWCRITAFKKTPLTGSERPCLLEL